MKRFAWFASLATVLPLAGACDLMNLLQGDAVIVQLVNDGDYAVRLELRISDNQYELQMVLEEFGDELNRTVAPGEMVTLVESCDDLQAIMIAEAELEVVGDSGPRNSTDILRDGDDFGCGDVIVYTFDHPTPPTSLSIETDILD